MTKPPLFHRCYAVLLLAYPADFRREYGLQMRQLLRDCQRAEKTRAGLFAVSLRTLADLIRTVPLEHFEKLRRENTFMKNLRRDLIALIGCIGIITIALLLLNYGRTHAVSSILLFGYVLDAVIVTGIVGNLIVFLLIKFTRFNPLKVALWTFLMVHAVPAVALAVIGPNIDPHFPLANILVGYAVSFLFWYGVHWLWSQKSGAVATT